MNCATTCKVSKEHHYSFEAAARVIYIAARPEEKTEWLRWAFETSSHNKKLIEDLQVWCGMLGLRLAGDAHAYGPILKAVEIAYPQAKKLNFDQLQSLVLCHHAVDAESIVAKARAKLRGIVGTEGLALLKYLAKEDEFCEALTHREVFHAFSPDYGVCTALILAERLDVDRDGYITVKDATTWLCPPRSVKELRLALASWCSTQHDASPRRAFDALDQCGSGLLTRNDFSRFDTTLTEPELDALFLSIDDDGSGCISADEFRSWLLQIPENEIRLRHKEDDENTIASYQSQETHQEAHSSGIFAAAAAQLREALIERCSSSEGDRTSSSVILLEKLRLEFEKIDTDKSGGISLDEFADLLLSVGVQVITTEDNEKEIKGQETRHLATFRLENNECTRKAPLQAMGITVEERVIGRRGCDRSLFVRSVHTTETNLRERDEILSVCGKEVQSLAAELDYDQAYVDRGQMDALTRKLLDTLTNFITESTTSNHASLTVRRFRTSTVTRAQLEILLKGMDEDNNGTISFDEIKQFVLDSPDAGEAELSLVIAAIREHATKLAETDNTSEEEEQQLYVSAAARVFEALGRRYGTSKANHHVLKSSVIKRWLSEIQVDAGRGRMTTPSRRQVSLILGRLDANGDGVVSRSEFDAWIFPRRALDEIVKILRSCAMNEPFKGDVVQLHDRLRGSLNDDLPLNRLDFARNLVLLGCPLKPDEIRLLFDAINKKGGSKRLPLRPFADLLGFNAETVDQYLKARASSAPLPVPPAQNRVKPSHTNRTKAVRTIIPNQHLCTDVQPTIKKKKKIVQMTPTDLARDRALAREKQACSKTEDNPPPTHPVAFEIEEPLMRLQARVRSRPCRSMHDALRREAQSHIQTESALLELAALKLELVDSRSRFTARAVELEAKHRAELEERDARVAKAEARAAEAYTNLERREAEMQRELSRLLLRNN